MESQLGMITPFFHKAPCGGMIKQETAPEQTANLGFAHQPQLKYFCMNCHQFVEPADVVEEKEPVSVTTPTPPPEPTPQEPPPPAPTEKRSRYGSDRS